MNKQQRTEKNDSDLFERSYHPVICLFCMFIPIVHSVNNIFQEVKTLHLHFY